MSNKVQHLEFIQGVVNRMASNSFQLKGWSVVLVSALFALGAKDADVTFVYLAYLPAAAFWILDGYFLHQERLFRRLYDAVRVRPGNDSDFSMKTTEFVKDEQSWPRVCFSKTLLAFHGVVLSAIVVTMAAMTAFKQ